MWFACNTRSVSCGGSKTLRGFLGVPAITNAAVVPTITCDALEQGVD